MIYQFIETLLSEELMLEHHVQYGVCLLYVWNQPYATNDELFQEIIYTTNEVDGVFLGIREFIPPKTKYSYDPYFYQNGISDELNDFMFGDQSSLFKTR